MKEPPRPCRELQEEQVLLITAAREDPACCPISPPKCKLYLSKHWSMNVQGEPVNPPKPLHLDLQLCHSDMLTQISHISDYASECKEMAHCYSNPAKLPTEKWPDQPNRKHPHNKLFKMLMLAIRQRQDQLRILL